MTNKVTIQSNDYLLDLFTSDCYENDNEVNDYFAINSTYNKSIVDWINNELGLSIEYINYLNPIPYVSDDMRLNLHISDSDLNKLFNLNRTDDHWFNETTKVIERYRIFQAVIMHAIQCHKYVMINYLLHVVF